MFHTLAVCDSHTHKKSFSCAIIYSILVASILFHFIGFHLRCKSSKRHWNSIFEYRKELKGFCFCLASAAGKLFAIGIDLISFCFNGRID